MVGQRIRPIEARAGVLPSLIVRAPNGGLVGIPLWMTTEIAAAMVLGDLPLLSLEALLGLASLVQSLLSAFSSGSDVDASGSISPEEKRNGESATANIAAPGGQSKPDPDLSRGGRTRDDTDHRGPPVAGRHRRRRKTGGPQ